MKKTNFSKSHHLLLERPCLDAIGFKPEIVISSKSQDSTHDNFSFFSTVQVKETETLSSTGFSNTRRTVEFDQA